MQDSALKRPTARSAQSPATLKSKRGAQGALAQKLNASARVVAQRALAAQLNRGGLPENLRNGVERLSGVSLAGVKVHYNSAKPSQLNAEAYAQGRDIHLAPGKAHHLPHEAWHVAQQAQGRVKPTTQMQEAVPINDDKRLEKEADELGKEAATLGTVAQRAVPTDPKKKKNEYTANTTFKPSASADSKTEFENIIFWNVPGSNRDKMDWYAGTVGTLYNLYVYSKMEDTETKKTIESVRTATGTQENIKTVQKDHIIPWAKFAGVMREHNSEEYPKKFELTSAAAATSLSGATAKDSGPTDALPKTIGDVKAKAPNAGNAEDAFYTLHDAKQYYNDIGNLQFLLASDNASKGAKEQADEVEKVGKDAAASASAAAGTAKSGQEKPDWADIHTIFNHKLQIKVAEVQNKWVITQHRMNRKIDSNAPSPVAADALDVTGAVASLKQIDNLLDSLPEGIKKSAHDVPVPSNIYDTTSSAGSTQPIKKSAKAENKVNN